MKTDAFTLHPVLDALAWTLIHSLWQAGIVALVVALLFGLTKSLSARLRYHIAVTGLVLIPVLAVVTYLHLIQPAEVELIPRTAFAAASDLSDAEAFFTLGHLQSPDPAQVVDEVVNDELRIAIVLSWMTGSLLFALRLAAGFVGVRRLTRSGTSIPDALLQKVFDRLLVGASFSREVSLVVSSIIDVPMTVGWIRPCVLLPASVVSGFPPEAIEAFIAHELMHVRRFDYLINLLQHVVEALFFYHPATWWLSRKIRDEREFCCDDLAIKLLDNRLVYVTALAGLAETRQDVGLATAASDSPLLFRIQRLLASASTSQSGSARGPAVLVTAALLIGLFAIVVPLSLEAAERVIPRSALFQPNTRTAVKVSFVWRDARRNHGGCIHGEEYARSRCRLR